MDDIEIHCLTGDIITLPTGCIMDLENIEMVDDGIEQINDIIKIKNLDIIFYMKDNNNKRFKCIISWRDNISDYPECNTFVTNGYL